METIEQTKMNQNLINIAPAFRDFVVNNSRFFIRFFRSIFLNIALLIGIAECFAIGVKAYDIAWGLTEHEFYAFIFWVCVVIASVFFVMMIVINFKMIVMRINEDGACPAKRS